jgi:dipeptidyl aminopeptidase/acylaminoacyl peptidase
LLNNEHTTTTQSARTPVKPGAYLSMRVLDDVNLSPDGKRVAYVVWERLPDQPKRRGSILLVESSGGEPRLLSQAKRADSCPRWSPNSQQLAYISKGEGEKDKPQLHLLSVDGGEPRQVCTMPNGVSNLAWSPDGSRISFLSLEGEEPQTDPLVVAPGRHQRLWTVHPNHDIPEPINPADITVWEYAWSPDSKHLALYYSNGPDDTDWYRGQIGIVASNGGAVRQVSRLTRQASSLTWSPDSTRIAYISGEWSDPGRGCGDIFVQSVEGGEARNLTPGIEFSPSWCRWFPDGHRLLYTACEGVSHQIGILEETTGSTTALSKDFVMQWDQPGLSLSSDLHCFATMHTSQQHPYDVWFGELTSTDDKAESISWRRLTRLNPLFEETTALAPSEHIRYPSVDDWQIDALFTPPLTSKDTGLPPPLFVNVHGGPSGAWCDDLGLFYTQMLAAAGYAVLRPNTRGSWGRGVAFADAVLGDMGGKDLQDILCGVDYLVQQGRVDGNRVSIGGWSNGGFLAAWAITQTTRFKAAIMGAGISDWHNMHAQTNLADADMRLLQADPLENPAIYRERSPITYAGRVTTPTLILHGEDDPAVPVAQAYAFYRALRERNVPVEFVVYPREGHGVGEPKHVIDSEERLLCWLERYV